MFKAELSLLPWWNMKSKHSVSPGILNNCLDHEDYDEIIRENDDGFSTSRKPFYELRISLCFVC